MSWEHRHVRLTDAGHSQGRRYGKQEQLDCDAVRVAVARGSGVTVL